MPREMLIFIIFCGFATRGFTFATWKNDLDIPDWHQNDYKESVTGCYQQSLQNASLCGRSLNK